jgi:organic hydroperoxide reductase OsmC/OhrA
MMRLSAKKVTMQEYPHHYIAAAAAGPEGEVNTTSGNLEPIAITSPPEFGGPEGRWSPETLLVAAVADCFILTFRAIARGSRFDWIDLDCKAEGILDRVEGVTRFTGFKLRAVLRVAPGASEEKALRLMHKAEHVCLITRSMICPTELEAMVEELSDERAA